MRYNRGRRRGGHDECYVFIIITIMILSCIISSIPGQRQSTIDTWDQNILYM